MTLTLVANIDATTRRLRVTGSVAGIAPGYAFRLDDELLTLQGFISDGGRYQDPTGWYVNRGQDGSTAASHTAGADILGATDAFASADSGTTPPSPWSGGGPGSTPTLDAVLAEGNDADGFTIEGIVDSSNSDGVVTRGFVLANGGSGISSPLDIGGCILWLDASQLTLADDDPVATWPDLSTSGYDATQATSENQPICKTAIQNGLRMVRFDPTEAAQFLTLTGDGLGLINGLSAVTTACLIREARDAVAGALLGIYAHTTPKFRLYLGPNIKGEANLNASMLLQVSPTDLGEAGGITASLIIDAGATVVEPTAGGDYAVAFPMVHAVDLVAGASALDGSMVGTASQSSDPDAYVLQPFLDTDAAAIVIGGDDVTFAPLQNDVGELIVYGRALNARERRQLVEYLSDKWGTL